MDNTYNGWKNYETWNIALWVNNQKHLYFSAKGFMKTYEGKKPYRDFIRFMKMANDRTNDNVRFLSTDLDLTELNEMMIEFK